MKTNNPQMMIISLCGMMIIVVGAISMLDKVSVSQSQLLYGNIVVMAMIVLLLLTSMRSLAQHYIVAYMLLCLPIYQIFLISSQDVSAWWYLVALYSYTGVVMPQGTYEIKPIKHNLSKKLLFWYEERVSKIRLFS